ncbi:MAG: Methyltransferase protein [Frankiales bacterium]|jgi:arsenite methyltransferase|nr:Methyltransferase protein [Frankiales bacterium]
MSDDGVREQVRERYARAATAVTQDHRTALTVLDERCCSFGAGLYGADQQGELPAEAIAASLGCGNPIAVAELRAGEKVLDLGSGGGIDVLLSARRVGPTGFAYGVDMTEEMLALAEANKVKSGLTNVAFVKGTIEAVPLPDASVNVVISNCVINLSTDKAAVIAEMFRVLTPGGRIGVSDVVAEDDLTPEMRAERGSYVGCIAGALSKAEYIEGLLAAGFTNATVTYTHDVAEGMHGAIVNAIKPSDCCAPAQQASCCEPTAKASCCGTATEHASGSCGCS